MADFERRQFEIGLELVRRSSSERKKFNEGSLNLQKTPEKFKCGGQQPHEFLELELLVCIFLTIVKVPLQQSGLRWYILNSSTFSGRMIRY